MVLAWTDRPRHLVLHAHRTIALFAVPMVAPTRTLAASTASKVFRSYTDENVIPFYPTIANAPLLIVQFVVPTARPTEIPALLIVLVLRSLLKAPAGDPKPVLWPENKASVTEILEEPQNLQGLQGASKSPKTTTRPTTVSTRRIPSSCS
jgi:hypothetical protein